MNKTLRSIIDFCKKHPIVFNLGLIFIATLLIIWISLAWLDSWTSHGQYVVVPDVKGLTYQRANELLKTAGFYTELSDSVYSDTASPGEVMDQIPRAKDKVKSNRTIYL
ncbi:MAG: PASTA domain-containing protein, partial [Muribaculaceae bacterium]|nr:PASTA domain-containing protein [Muribaculaceae bacterium]